MIKEILTYDIESNDNPPHYNKQKKEALSSLSAAVHQKRCPQAPLT